MRPDRAATNIDSNILAKAWANENSAATSSPPVQQPGELQSTTSTVSGIVSAHVFAVQTAAVAVSRAELYPNLPPSAPSYLAYEANTSSTLHLFDAMSPLKIAANDRWSFNYWTVVPPLSNGFYFFGEAREKWVAVSTQRFISVVARGTLGGPGLSGLGSAVSSGTREVAHAPAAPAAGFVVVFAGKPGERVQLAWAPPIPAGGAAPLQKSTTCTVGPDGRGSGSFPEGKCS